MGKGKKQIVRGIDYFDAFKSVQKQQKAVIHNSYQKKKIEIIHKKLFDRQFF